MKEIIINHFLDYEFVYIFLLCSILFLLISIFIKQQIIRKLSIFTFSIFLILFLFELIISFFMPLSHFDFFFFTGRTEGMSFVKKEITFFDKNNKKHRCLLDENKFHMEDYEGCTFIFDKIYSVDNGVRITKCDNNSDNTFVFLGCSFVFGDGLNDDETLPYYFSKLYKFKNNIINYGMSGQASNTALNILDNIMLSGFLSQNSTIKHCFYTLISEHIKRNFKYEDCETYSFCSDGFLYKNKKWYIPTKIGKVRYAFARSYIFKKIFVPFIEEKFYKYYEDYMIQSLKEMNKRVEDKYDSKLTIIVWPDKYSERFIKKLKETKLDLIFLPEYFNEVGTYKIKDDYHPTARANEEIAEILYNHINGNDKTN